MALRIITLVLLAIWLLLVMLGKGGFIHLLLLSAVGTAGVEAFTVLRSRQTA
jgi:hypothetical protein